MVKREKKGCMHERQRKGEGKRREGWRDRILNYPEGESLRRFW